MQNQKTEEQIEEDKRKKALLVGCYRGTPQREVCEEHLQELQLLADTCGVVSLEQKICPLRTIDASTYVGKGKLIELQERAKELEVDLVIFDEEISPAQQRNLEKAFKIKVMDRTELILEVFSQRAQTKEARLQVELAQEKYQLPRLKRMWTHLSRQAGTGGSGAGAYLKGEGEKQIEIDRRLVKKRIERLQQELNEVRLHRETQRVARTRSGIPIFAIVGYTNAGKSTLINALTGAQVFVEDKLFATLDTTTRKYALQNNQEILLIDTVGFIRKLPHLLVAAFKSTLEEAVEADILLHLIDVSHPMAEEQAESSYQVLQELHAAKKPIITVLNKIDRCSNASMIQRMHLKYPKTVQISALHQKGFDELEEMMVEEISKQRKVVDLCIPQKDYSIVSEVIRLGNVLNQEYEGNDVMMRADLPAAVVGRLKQYLVEKS